VNSDRWFITQASGLSANRKCALSSALLMRVEVPLALKMRALYPKAGFAASLAGERGRYGEV
jgi:hypothetical protein